MTADSGGAGMDMDSPVQDTAKSTPDNYVEGYEMTQESVTNVMKAQAVRLISSSDIIASIFVIGMLGAIYIGFWKRRN
ncbi:MAG: hypothetical protein R2741_09450 [Methanolobus sp.]